MREREREREISRRRESVRQTRMTEVWPGGWRQGGWWREVNEGKRGGGGVMDGVGQGGKKKQARDRSDEYAFVET